MAGFSCLVLFLAVILSTCLLDVGAMFPATSEEVILLCSKHGIVGVVKNVGLVLTLLILQKHGKKGKKQ